MTGSMMVTPVLARKVWEAAIGKRGALEGEAMWSATVKTKFGERDLGLFVVSPTEAGFEFKSPPVFKFSSKGKYSVCFSDPEGDPAAEYHDSAWGVVTFQMPKVLASLIGD